MSFRDEMKEIVKSGKNEATNYQNACVANYESDIQNVTNIIIEKIKKGFKESPVNSWYFKESIFTLKKNKTNILHCFSIHILNRAKYEERVALKKDDRGRLYLVADKAAMNNYRAVVNFCIKNDIYNIKHSPNQNHSPCIYYIDKHWIRDNGLSTSGIDYHDDRPWAMNFYLMMYL